MNTLTSKSAQVLPSLDDPVSSESWPDATLIIKLSRSRDQATLFEAGFLRSVIALALQRVQSALRSRDLATLLTENEIAVNLHSASSVEDVEGVGKRIADLVQRTYVLEGKTMYLGATVGIAVSPMKQLSAEILLKRAAIAMYQAERLEPGSVVLFESTMEEQMWVQRSLSGALRKALPLRQLSIHYQPQVNLASRTQIGFEALLRWKHPERGWISPVEFIPLAEELGLISSVGRWVLREACRQAMSFPEDCTVAVNASPIQLKDGSILEAVKNALSLSGLAPHRLEVEVTEGILLEHSKHIRTTLDTLHAMGIRLALDDFGTGYSSLGQLAKLPFDRIKIDRALISSGGKNRAIVRAIALLGKGLELSTLAEGIESEEEYESACTDGCTCGQGYLFGKPMPAEELTGSAR